jgi:hypothetical protein
MIGALFKSQRNNNEICLNIETEIWCCCESVLDTKCLSTIKKTKKVFYLPVPPSLLPARRGGCCVWQLDSTRLIRPSQHQTTLQVLLITSCDVTPPLPPSLLLLLLLRSQPPAMALPRPPQRPPYPSTKSLQIISLLLTASGSAIFVVVASGQLPVAALRFPRDFGGTPTNRFISAFSFSFSIRTFLSALLLPPKWRLRKGASVTCAQNPPLPSPPPLPTSSPAAPIKHRKPYTRWFCL